jgi:ribosomal protein L36
MICSCQPKRTAGHSDDCLVAQAMKFRCPECRSRRRAGVGYVIRHTNLCKLKEYQP